MKILYLSEEVNKKFISFLEKKGNVTWIKDKIDPKTKLDFDIAVSYGYRHIISNEIIDKLNNNIINLHISYLPHNRGANPNYWSFKDNTPKGVTIHLVDEGIDTGPILVQKLCNFNNDEHTLESSYNILKDTIEKLFYESFDNIINGKINPKPQKGKGSFHYKSDLLKPLDYKIKINNI